jgi:hypothetical protein
MDRGYAEGIWNRDMAGRYGTGIWNGDMHAENKTSLLKSRLVMEK